jgi:hypothetical protein
MKKQKKFLYLFVIIICAALTAHAQTVAPEALFIRNRQGDPFMSKNGGSVEGSPYFPADYSFAVIKSSDGKNYEKPRVRLGLIDNTIYFIGDDSSEMMVGMPVKRIDFFKYIDGVQFPGYSFQAGFAAIDKQTDKTFYQVLDSGKVKLLKYLFVTYSDERPFNSAVTTRVFKTTETLYASLPDGQMVKFLKNKESVVNILADKRSQVEAFINSKGLKCKKEQEIITVFNYYNTL